MAGGNGARIDFARETAKARTQYLKLEARQMEQHAEIRELRAELARDRNKLGEALAALALAVKEQSDEIADLKEAIITSV